jgi:uncharacterized membrane protein
MRWLVLVLVGCTKIDTDSDEVDFCADKPVLTYDNFGEGFMTQYCQTCHSSELMGEDRHDAPSSVHFDSEAEVAAQVAQILGVATGPSPIMPPGGGVSDLDREKLEIWLKCHPPETD